LAKRRARAATVKHWQRVTPLLSQRDQLIDEILVRSRAGGSSPLLKKATTLLTRFWVRADWKSREEILRAARWVLSVGATQSAMATAKARPSKPDRHSVGADFKSEPKLRNSEPT
jgi:hypothetical protein